CAKQLVLLIGRSLDTCWSVMVGFSLWIDAASAAVFWLMLGRAPLAPARAGPRVLPVRRDHLDQEIEQQFAFLRGERIENACTRSHVVGSQPRIELFSLRREIEQARAAVGAVDAALDQAALRHLFDQQARVVAVDADARGKPALVNSRLALVFA